MATELNQVARDIVTSWVEETAELDKPDGKTRLLIIDRLTEVLVTEWNIGTSRIRTKFRKGMKDIKKSKEEDDVRWKKRGLCRKHIGSLITHDCGKCVECGNMTTSGMYQRCHECAEKQNKCMRCEEAIVVG